MLQLLPDIKTPEERHMIISPERIDRLIDRGRTLLMAPRCQQLIMSHQHLDRGVNESEPLTRTAGRVHARPICDHFLPKFPCLLPIV